MRVDEFDFELPEELIALRPAQPRSASRLLHVGDSLHDRQFEELVDVLMAGDLLVLNNTRVIPAALKGVRRARDAEGTDVTVDCNLHKVLPLSSDGHVCWAAFARPAKRVREGDLLTFSAALSARVLRRGGAEVDLEFMATPNEFETLLAEAGNMPLPPYIGRKRDVDEQDTEDYQTVYAREQGSVAAPTAGLHFTPELFAALEQKGVQRAEVTLHVGAGTFLPVAVEDTDDHQMHAEWGEVSAEVAALITQTRAQGNRVISVGTTSLRLLESAAAKTGKVQPFRDETDIFITPGYRFRAVDGLITNFHLPRSTLFMLVSAFTGQVRMREAYTHAIASGYRFYSYGDACYLERHDN